MRAALFIVALAFTPARGAENPGVTGAAILQIPMGSRALAMGSAFTAVGGDASALYYNPASMSRLNAQEVGLSYFSGLSDNALQEISYAGPTPFLGLCGNGRTSAGASLLYSQSGVIEYNRLDSNGSLQSSQNLNAGTDLVASLGYSEEVASTPLELPDMTYGIHHFLGVSGKYIRSTLAGAYSAQSVAADIGYLAHSPEAGLSAGISLLNAGNEMKFINVGDPLPLMTRLGVAYQFTSNSEHSFLTAVDGVYSLHEKIWQANIGEEYLWQKTFALRGGYQFFSDTLGLTLGFGLRINNRILIDYAWGMSQTMNDTHHFTISYRFGALTSAERGRERKPVIEFVPEREQLKGLDNAAPLIEKPRQAYPQDNNQALPGWIY